MDQGQVAALVEKLKHAGGDNLRSVVLYGSAASEEFNEKHSDLNTLCLLHEVNASRLFQIRDVIRWWVKKRHPAPLIFTLQDLQRSADIYAIELLEIESRRRILYGEDVFASLHPPMHLYRQQVERELRHGLIRLRQAYALSAGNRKSVLALMVESVSTFGLLFRHALIALGEQAPAGKQDAIERLSVLLGFGVTSFRELAAVRDGTRAGKSLDARLIFRDYLDAITCAVDSLDERLAGIPGN